MIPGYRNAVRSIAAAAGLVLLVMACGASTPSTPSTSPYTTASPTPNSTPTPTSTIVLPPASATAGPGASAPAPTACPIEPQTGRLPSDRLVDVVISSSGSADLVTFVFGDSSLPTPPQGTSKGSLDVAVPPYAEGGSGLPIKVDGERVVSVRFTGMSLSNDLGQPAYEGRTDFRPDLAALRTVVNFDRFEGAMGWLIGFDGGGCVTLSSDRRSVSVSIAHPAG